jgi:HD-GYP domain-containing protein (c-di-GMP phosphodiesterase class II)
MAAEATAAAAEFRVKELEDELRELRSAVVLGLNQLLDLKDLSTGCHSTRLAQWALRVGLKLGLDGPSQRNLEAASILHDIGKIGVPDTVLLKPGPLRPRQFAEIKRHPEYSWTILRLFSGFEPAALFALHHHERFDGKGYPSGLKAERIPLGARIVSVVDSYDAMVSDRVYRKGLPVEEALRRLRVDREKQFDPDVVDHFVDIVLASPEDESRSGPSLL